MASTLQELLISLCGEIKGKSEDCIIRVHQLIGSNRVTGHVSITLNNGTAILAFEVQGTLMHVNGPLGPQTLLHLNGRNGGDEIIVVVNVNEKGVGHGVFQYGPKHDKKDLGPAILGNCK